MTTEYALDESPQATVGADGVAETLPIGPNAQGEEWSEIFYSISLTAGTGTCRVYKGFASARRQIDFTSKGEGDTSEQLSLKLRRGETILARWTGATPGAIATFHIEGARRVPGRRAYGV